ncbi:hypothetical protein [Pyrobaculum ferrireducens]|uniref:Uncharacterized protein n=1 Tax=Pyrobaculum ferrireducens TaxID=1104324 RepID=G7VEL0_9CREN|nr:hypothetical protein [Pyrobaculum ferrireducens]AET31634.1 hypothetical protein P186_0173 [Pyrobaculum ferrireducens]
MKDAVEAYSAWAETEGKPPVVKRVAPYSDERTWHFGSPTAVSIRLMSGRHIVELWPRKRFWRFEWMVMTGRAQRSSTIRLKRVKNKVYAIFTYEV